VSGWPRRPSRGRKRLAFTKDGIEGSSPFAPGPSNGLGEHDARITIQDAETLEQIGPPIEPEAFVGAYVGFQFASPSFALAEDDRLLLTASEDGELAAWDMRSGAKTRALPIAMGLHAFALSPDGRTAAVGIERGIQLVDVRTGDEATGGLAAGARTVLFSPDGRRSSPRTTTGP
jgi:WD40 repeat protein